MQPLVCAARETEMWTWWRRRTSHICEESDRWIFEWLWSDGHLWAFIFNRFVPFSIFLSLIFFLFLTIFFLSFQILFPLSQDCTAEPYPTLFVSTSQRGDLCPLFGANAETHFDYPAPTTHCVLTKQLIFALSEQGIADLFCFLKSALKRCYFHWLLPTSLKNSSFFLKNAHL